MKFREDFVWGAACSAYQTEGYPNADGGGVSVWDVFSHTAGKTFDGETGDIACDGYHRYQQDIDLLASLHLSAYRFSTSWARVDPQGDGNWNEAGLAYYDRVVDACLAAGVTPWMTLYHWELPQALQQKGGWANRDTAAAFARYAGMMAIRFQGRVTHYITLNEPQCAIGLGYGNGQHAPGLKLPLPQLFFAWCNILRAHGLAMRAMQAADGAAQIGFASTGRLCYPATDSADDIDAARLASFAPTDDDWTFTHSMALDPVCYGRFPNAGGGVLAKLIAAVPAADLAEMHEPPDFVGYNIYNGWQVRLGADGKPGYVPRGSGYPRTAVKWPVTPDVLDWGVRYLYERYPLPTMISENGLSCNDKVYLDGAVHDADRIDFLHRYLLALGHAVDAGVDLRGYFHWSLTDNYEWDQGYNERFGLIFVDYLTQQRLVKDSGRWFAEVANTNGANL